MVERDEPPPPRRWFQLAIRSGVAIPSGELSANNEMSGALSPQLPLFLEAGLKIHPMVFVGAYTSFQFGGVTSAYASSQGCTSGSSRGCGSTDWTIGIEAQVHFRPGERINPWFGYGLGFEQVALTASGGNAPGTGETLSGFELARLSGGVDFRVSHLFGIGPFVGVDFGTYSQEHVQAAGASVDQSIPNTALHEWFTLGVRGVLFP